MAVHRAPYGRPDNLSEANLFMAICEKHCES